MFIFHHRIYFVAVLISISIESRFRWKEFFNSYIVILTIGTKLSHTTFIPALARLLTTLEEMTFEIIVRKRLTSMFSLFHMFYSSENKLQLLSNVYFVVCKCFDYGLLQIFNLGNKLHYLAYYLFSCKTYMVYDYSKKFKIIYDYINKFILFTTP